MKSLFSSLRWWLLVAVIGARGQGSGGYVFGPLAGRGLFASAEGTGRAAAFSGPTGMARDGAGNLYVADNFNHTIRKVTPAGAVTTLAGAVGFAGSADGSGSAARFNFPQSVAVDVTGNVYVADTANHTIRRITPSGVVSTWAGTAGAIGSTDGDRATAGFNSPTGVVVDGAGVVYVADSKNSTIRKISPAGTVTTLAGQVGSAGMTDGAGAAARFTEPTGLALDGAGNLYVADTKTAPRRITPAAVVTTITGQDAAGANVPLDVGDPGAIAVGGDGTLYLALRFGEVILTISPTGRVATLAGLMGTWGFVDATGGTARFSSPNGLATDPTGGIYVADTSNAAIRRVSPAGAVTTFAGRGPAAGFANGTGTEVQFNGPAGMAVGLDGTVYVADRFNNTIRKIAPDGAVSSFAGSPQTEGKADGTGAAAGFDFPGAVAVDPAGNVFVADSANSTIRKITPAGVVTTIAGDTNSFGYAD